VLVAKRTPCLGPVTQAGCGALCPAYDRGCYGCFGPKETPNVPALMAQWRALGADDRTILRALRTFNANAPAFREASVSRRPDGDAGQAEAPAVPAAEQL
jgi:hypothetical protein